MGLGPFLCSKEAFGEGYLPAGAGARFTFESETDS